MGVHENEEEIPLDLKSRNGEAKLEPHNPRRRHRCLRFILNCFGHLFGFRHNHITAMPWARYLRIFAWHMAMYGVAPLLLATGLTSVTYGLNNVVKFRPLKPDPGTEVLLYDETPFYSGVCACVLGVFVPLFSKKTRWGVSHYALSRLPPLPFAFMIGGVSLKK